MQRESYTVGHAQIDGRRYVAFAYVLDDGTELTTERGPLPKDADVDRLLVSLGDEIVEQRETAAQERALREAAVAKVDAALIAAVRDGALTDDDIKKGR